MRERNFEMLIGEILFSSIGHALHEWTSYTAFESIFKFFGEQRSRIERSKRS